MADNKKGQPAKGGKGAPPGQKGKSGGQQQSKSGPPQTGKAALKEAKGRQRDAGSDIKLATAEELVSPKDYVPRMKTLYAEKIRAQMTERFQYKNAFEVPQIEKIVINMGVGDAVNDTKKVTAAAGDLALIAGQRPVITRARQAISTFKLRENMPIGAKVTLRKTRMYEFLDRLVTIALPRIRDFRGLNPKSFDGRGNFAVGIKEHIVFPEINYDRVEAVVGMDIIVCTTAKTDEEARALLGGFDFPFRQ